MAIDEKKQGVTVERWVSFDESEAFDCVGGGMGGMVEAPELDEYMDSWTPEGAVYVEAIMRALDALGHAPSGEAHQRQYTPVFSDGRTMSFSMRGWGDLAAVWWNSRNHDGPRKNYLNFYMDGWNK